MNISSPGRPTKPDAQKRQPLHISLYGEDFDRLNQLTDNRSEFIRTCIEKAWEKENGEEITLTVTLPKWLIDEIVGVVVAGLPAAHANMVKTVVSGWIRSAQQR